MLPADNLLLKQYAAPRFYLYIVYLYFSQCAIGREGKEQSLDKLTGQKFTDTSSLLAFSLQWERSALVCRSDDSAVVTGVHQLQLQSAVMET